MNNERSHTAYASAELLVGSQAGGLSGLPPVRAEASARHNCAMQLVQTQQC